MKTNRFLILATALIAGLLNPSLSRAQSWSTGDVAVYEKKSTAGFELKAVEDTGLILPLANGGLGASLSDPGADRILFWDDSGTTATWLTLGSGLSISGTTLSASALLGDADYGDIVVSSSGTVINVDTAKKSTGALGSGDAGKFAVFGSGGYLMGTVVSAGDSITPGNDYITLETDGVNGQTIRGYHTDGMDEHEYILHLPTTSMSGTSVEWWLPAALPTVNGQVLTGQTDGTTAWATASGGIAGSLGSTDNAVPRADGTGGATLQSSGVTISDSDHVSAARFSVTGTAGYLDSNLVVPGAVVSELGYIGMNPAQSVLILRGAGSPEGVKTASPGSLYLRSDGGAGTCLYVKESGTGDTGWVAK